ncbi:DUF6764 family protein [Nocardia shimofusensis]|uniref:DUF6764 family protein n=1 Tax=Nocardia shimofusensis TaxID=228596 RepID=UPI000833E60F|nr:DUF6764 family protein [Nocardia shimofusensis]
MKFVDAIVCATAAVGAASVLPATASASAVHCAADAGIDATVIEGGTGCRAAGSVGGQAHSVGLDGVGYANAALGSQALGVGVAGGVGASEGVEGLALAAGFGPDALALSTGADREPDTAPSRTVAIAFAGSRAEVGGGLAGSVVCLGAGALAWDERSGAACLATPFGIWTLPGDSASERLR